MINKTQKIALGTVQFGLKYGINNKKGMPDDVSLNKLLNFVVENRINTFDTAHSYGESEHRLGKLSVDLKSKINFISKTPSGTNIKDLCFYFNESISRLKINLIYGYLLHDFNDYMNDKTIFKSLLQLKNKGFVSKIGFSLYHPEELEIILNDSISFDLIQFPYNLADRRFEKFLPELKNQNVETYARSVFLQGLFFMKPEALSEKMKPFSNFISALNEIGNKLNRSIENISLNFVLQNEYLDKAVIGVDTIEQFRTNLDESKKPLTEEEYNYICDELLKINLPNNLLLPYNWN